MKLGNNFTCVLCVKLFTNFTRHHLITHTNFPKIVIQNVCLRGNEKSLYSNNVYSTSIFTLLHKYSKQTGQLIRLDLSNNRYSDAPMNVTPIISSCAILITMAVSCIFNWYLVASFKNEDNITKFLWNNLTNHFFRQKKNIWSKQQTKIRKKWKKSKKKRKKERKKMFLFVERFLFRTKTNSDLFEFTRDIFMTENN